MGMFHLRLTTPHPLTAGVLQRLTRDEAVTNLTVQSAVSLRPVGDLLCCDVAREATDILLQDLRALGLHEEGGIAVTEIKASPSRNAMVAERVAPGAPDDSVVWDVVVDEAESSSRGSWSFYAFLTLAAMIAAVAVITDSSILVVGAMVVGPEFGAVSALAVGLAQRRPRLARRSLLLLLRGFALAIAITAAAGALAAGLGWLDAGIVQAARPLTGFIWRPDRWSVVVALLAGCAGVLSSTAGRSNALVGVFISVTTVPAAGDFALALATGA